MMNYYEKLMLSEILLGIEFLACLVAILYFFRLKNSYWKWFCIYLIFICIQEFFWSPKFSFPGFRPKDDIFLGIERPEYYAFIGIPVQYLFFFWLFALKSLKRKKLFLSCSLIYLATYFPIELYYEKINKVYTLNLTIGTLLLSVLIVLEFKRLIQTDEIFNFTRSKMFYITIGVILFYIGTYPFFAFNDVLREKPYIGIWNLYYLYFLLSNCIMYLLFIASFIWGATKD